MKILHISTYHPEHPGGVERVIKELSKNLDHEIDILCFGKGKKKIDYGRIIQLKLPNRFFIGFYLLYQFFFLVKHRADYDLIHAHKLGATVGLLNKIGIIKCPVVFNLHGVTAEWISNFSFYNIRYYLVSKLQKIGHDFCDKVIYVSKGEMEEARKHYGKKENYEVIYNGVNNEKFSPYGKKEARKEIGLPLEEFVVLWLGGLVKKRKGFDIARKASRMAGVLIVTNTQHSVSEHHESLGHLEESLLPKLYSAADVFVLPSRGEGHPLVVLEALSCGCPVICSSHSNVEIIENGEQGYTIDSLDPKDYSEKIMKLKKNDCRSMSKSAKNLAKNFRWKKQAKKYQETYVSMVK